MKNRKYINDSEQSVTLFEKIEYFIHSFYDIPENEKEYIIYNNILSDILNGFEAQNILSKKGIEAISDWVTKSFFNKERACFEISKKR